MFKHEIIKEPENTISVRRLAMELSACPGHNRIGQTGCAAVPAPEPPGPVPLTVDQCGAGEEVMSNVGEDNHAASGIPGFRESLFH